MTPEEQRYYDDLLDLFRLRGWKRFVELHQAALDSLDASWWQHKDPAEIHRRQGARDIHMRIVNFERITREDLELAEADNDTV